MQSNVVIVPTFSVNSSSIIDDFIDKINNQTIPHLDIVVVNNNEFELHITKKNHKGKLYIINPGKNMGSAGGFYLGMKYAHEVIKHYEFMILADDDAIILQNNGLETLIHDADENIITNPFRSNLSIDSHEDVYASISCYGIIHHKVVAKLGYYNPLFFYGAEDGAYGLELYRNGIKIKNVKTTSFYHPYKTFFSGSRGSSGLSTFRFNSILQHIYNFYFSCSLKSFLLIRVYIFSLFYMLFLSPYFRIRIITNFRNLLLYIPAIFGYKNTIPYYDDDSDSVIKTINIDSVFYDSYFVTYPYKKIFGNNLSQTPHILILDSRFPFTTYQDLKHIIHGFLFSYSSVELLHFFDGKTKEFMTKTIISFASNIQKYLYILLVFVFFPLILFLATIFFLGILLKYILILFIFQFMEKSLVRDIFKGVQIFPIANQ